MNSFSIITHQILILGLMMLTGFIAGRAGILDREGSKAVSKLIVNVTFALLLLTTIPQAEIEPGFWSDIVVIIVTAGLAVIGLLLTSKFTGKLLRLPGEKQSIFTALHMFGNVVFLAFPLLEAMFGARGIFYGVFFNFVNDAFLWSLGVYVIEAGGEKFGFGHLKNLININLIAFIVSIGMLLSGVKISGVLYEAFHPIGRTTFSLSMLFLGASFSRARLADVWQEGSVYLLAATKLIIVPVLAGTILWALQIRSFAAQIAVLQIAMPSAVIIPVLTERYGKDSVFATRGVVVTTLLALITLPAVVYLVGRMF